MTTQEQMDRYDEKYKDMAFLEIEKNILAMSDQDPDKEPFYEIFIDTLTLNGMNGLLRYQSPSDLENLRAPLERYVNCHEDVWAAEAILAFMDGKHKKCIDCITKALIPSDDITEPFNEVEFGNIVLGVFKNAFPGFYAAIRKACDSFPTDDVVKLLCEKMDMFYATEDPDQMAEALYPILQQYPDSLIGNMLLGYTHYIANRWGSAIACFEKIENRNMNTLFWDDEIHFFKGWSYGKLKEHQNAIREYKLTLEIFPKSPNALNNMGYEYYLLKQYAKAEQIFKQCLEEDRDARWAANNYVRVLLSTGRYADAKAFIAEGKYKISSGLKKRVEGAKNVNLNKHDAPLQEEQDEAESGFYIKKIKQNAGAQFSSEKILEDELTSRIDSGKPVFGKHLKIYRRHGEFGRQYIIPIGRLDLLAEDDTGNLYIIELKKDSGYDDPYEQTAAYLDWFEKNHKEKGKEIFGIICLNNPKNDLIEKVRQDSRMRLFNYTISYDEIT